jgi:TetR/AcrR family transcriptional regulator
MTGSSVQRKAPQPQAARAARRPELREGSVIAWGNALPGPSERAEIKRESIVRAAARSFNRVGFHGTSMDDIAAHLGVTKAALYRYVQNKHEILFACFNLGLDSGFAHLDRGEKEGANGLEKLRIALRGYLEDMIGELGHPSALLEENALLPEHAKIIIRRRDEAEKRFRNLVREGIADGSVIPCDPKLAIFSLLGAIQWVPKWYRDNGEWTPAMVADSMIALIMRSIEAHPATPDGPIKAAGRRPKKQVRSDA